MSRRVRPDPVISLVSAAGQCCSVHSHCKAHSRTVLPASSRVQKDACRPSPVAHGARHAKVCFASVHSLDACGMMRVCLYWCARRLYVEYQRDASLPEPLPNALWTWLDNACDSMGRPRLTFPLISLLEEIMVLDPLKRITASKALKVRVRCSTTSGLTLRNVRGTRYKAGIHAFCQPS